MNENAQKIVEFRYLNKDKNGNATEDWTGLVSRVATAVAQAEKEDVREEWIQKFTWIMENLYFLPNTPTLVNAGRKNKGAWAGCYVVPLSDSMEEIMKTSSDAAMIQKFGGGVGYPLSNLRPKGESIESTHGIACGPISVLKHLDDVARMITQGGVRDGANMAVMAVSHPDILEFIHCKDTVGDISRFNISIGATEIFMNAVAKNKKFKPMAKYGYFTVPESLQKKLLEKYPEYKIVNDKVKDLPAQFILQEAAECAWRTGDPGLIFLDRVNRDNQLQSFLGPIQTTNPCGEQPLLPYQSCTLGSVDVSKCIDNESINWTTLRERVEIGVRFLDDVVEVSPQPIQEIWDMVHNTRNIGFGLMGWHEALIKVGIPYDSEEAIDMAKTLMQFIQRTADRVSHELAIEKGEYPLFSHSKDSNNNRPAMRNVTRVTVAPTGSISLIAGCSSGIEPLFSLCNTRVADPEGKRIKIIEKNELFLEYAKKNNFDTPEMWDALSKGVSLGDWAKEHPEVPVEAVSLFKTAMDITPDWHIKMQSQFQRYCDTGISKTINLPESAGVEDIVNAYIMAFKEECKGITVYRDRSRSFQILDHDREENASDVYVPTRRRLPRSRPSNTDRFEIGGMPGYLTTSNFADGSPGEIFVVVPKEGSTLSGLMGAFARLFSVGLQYGIDVDELTDSLEGLKFEPSGMTDDPEVPHASSIIDYIAKKLRRRYVEKVDLGEKIVVERPSKKSGELCPECGEVMQPQSGCFVCTCGFARCG